MFKWICAALLVLVALGAGVFWFVCPCAQMPGGALAGTQSVEPVEDWTFVNDAGLCQLQVDRGVPWSVNLNCMAADGILYVSCARCAGKGWSTAALANPQSYLRAGSTVYPVRLQRVTEPAELDVAWSARLGKIGADPGTPRPDHWWSFRLTARDQSAGQ